jgi:transposase
MAKQFPKEVKDQAVRLVLDHRDDYDSNWAPIRAIASRLGMAL